MITVAAAPMIAKMRKVLEPAMAYAIVKTPAAKSTAASNVSCPSCTLLPLRFLLAVFYPILDQPPALGCRSYKGAPERRADRQGPQQRSAAALADGSVGILLKAATGTVVS
jgi:hypothetical protein